MIGLITSIIIFNVASFFSNNRLTGNQMLHIWLFTIAFQLTHDVILEFKYFAYWYVDKGIELGGLLGHLILIPPVNIIFLNYFPFNKKRSKQFIYIALWTVVILFYEYLTTLPEPWGYFHYGWWKIYYSAIEDPVLLFILIGFYRLVCKLEKRLCLE